MFSTLIHAAENADLIHGAKLSRGGPSTTHLFYADDSLIFGRANEKETEIVRGIILLYAEGILQISGSAGNSGSLQKIKDGFNFIIERVRKKLKDWKAKVMSQAGRMVLIKAVIQSIPAYFMSCFRLPMEILRKLEQEVSNFCFGQKAEEQRIHWHSSCRNKHEGGMGFRDVNYFNKAFLAKQAWRLAKNNNSHLAHCFRSRYHPRSSILDAKTGYRPSFAWRSICQGKTILMQGTLWQIRSGFNTRIWEDQWIPGFNITHLPFPVSSVLQAPYYVRDLMNDDGDKWNTTILQALFQPEVAEAIQRLPICQSLQDDQLRWTHTKDGQFTVKSGYWMTKNLKDATSSIPSSSSRNPSYWKWIWKWKIKPKIQVFLWKCLRGILPTKHNLIARNCEVDPMCQRCGMEIETSEHCLRDCPWSLMFWRYSKLRIDGQPHKEIDLPDWICFQIKDKPPEYVEYFATLLWTMWKERNLRIFQGKELNQRECFLIVDDMVLDFRETKESWNF